MIDCTKTTNYLNEKLRITKIAKNGVCKTKCSNCPLWIDNNGEGLSCTSFETLYPEEAIKIIQRWSDEHPQRTYLSEFLEHYPNASLHDDGTPHLCPSDLGWNDSRKCREQSNCVECWNQIISIEEDEE